MTEVTKSAINQILLENDCVLAYFSSPSCSICHSLKPKILSLKENYQNLKILDIDVSKNLTLVGDFQVFAAPTVVIFFFGKESARYSRSFGIGQLTSILDRFYEIMSKN